MIFQYFKNFVGTCNRVSMCLQNHYKFLILTAFLLTAFQFRTGNIFAQRIGIITPLADDLSEAFAKEVRNMNSDRFMILDRSLTKTAFSSFKYEKPFNLSQAEAKNIGQAIGADFFLLIRAETFRRYSLAKKEFFESYAAIYVVSSRTGRLIFWTLASRESPDSGVAENLLLRSAESINSEIHARISDAQAIELSEAVHPKLEELPDESSPDAVDLRPPLPYRRFSPNYTPVANLYGVEATVDILVDVDENGKILRTEISRWAGFGLDESVVKTITEMNWRPADRNGKRLPMRVLLRYNFTKPDNE